MKVKRTDVGAAGVTAYPQSVVSVRPLLTDDRSTMDRLESWPV